MGYPELRPVPEATGTPDGLAQAPYVREGRRLRACETVVEGDLSTEKTEASAGHGSSAIRWAWRRTSWTSIRARATSGGGGLMARPYQIPLGALVSPELRNFAAAGKGIGVTQITNGAYRLHTPDVGDRRGGGGARGVLPGAGGSRIRT